MKIESENHFNNRYQCTFEYFWLYIQYTQFFEIRNLSILKMFHNNVIGRHLITFRSFSNISRRFDWCILYNSAAYNSAVIKIQIYRCQMSIGVVSCTVGLMDSDIVSPRDNILEYNRIWAKNVQTSKGLLPYDSCIVVSPKHVPTGTKLFPSQHSRWPLRSNVWPLQHPLRDPSLPT